MIHETRNHMNELVIAYSNELLPSHTNGSFGLAHLLV